MQGVTANESSPGMERQPTRRPGRVGRAVIRLMKRLEWIDEDDTSLEHERGKEFLKTFMLLLMINGSAVTINSINQLINGDRELLDSQKWMDGWDVFFPAFFVAAHTADAKGNHHKASLLRVIAYTGHAAVAYLGGGQTYAAMQAGVGETESSLWLSGATGVANAGLFAREMRHGHSHVEGHGDTGRNRFGLWVSVTSNLAESVGGVAGAAAEPLFPGAHASAMAGMGMSAVVGTGMMAATAYELTHLRRLHKQTKHNKRLARQVAQQPLDRDGYPILQRDLMPDYSE